jgi:hypothetical protein
MMTNNVHKKTKKSSNQCENVKKQYEKSMNKEKKALAFNFSSIHLIHNNPQGTAEDHFDFMTETSALKLSFFTWTLFLA